jgi:hypothetical protein
MAQKLAAAKAYLGEAWVLHPRYDPNLHPSHSLRQACVLRPVAASARSNNLI